MKRVIVPYLSFVLFFKYALVAAQDSELTKAMKLHEVIPDLIDEAPAEMLEVSIFL